MTDIYYTYILKCSDETLYCGYAADIEARVEKHNSGKGAKYTRSRRPVTLLYCESFPDKSGAMKRECEIKRLTRTEKLNLIHDAKRRIPMKSETNFTLEHWSEEDYKRLVAHMYETAEKKYREFSSGLIPDNDKIIGIRIPALRALAGEIARGNAEEYIALKKGDIHEEILLEGFVIGNMKLDYPRFSEYIRYFADKVNNWAVSDCTSSSMKQIKKFREEFLSDIKFFISSPNPWHVRYGILFLMQYYIDDKYIDFLLDTLEKTDSDFYYVQMAQAWCLATAMVKYREKTLEALERGRFGEEVKNMFVRKVRDSYRISKEDKELVLKFKSPQVPQKGSDI